MSAPLTRLMVCAAPVMLRAAAAVAETGPAAANVLHSGSARSMFCTGLHAGPAKYAGSCRSCVELLAAARVHEATAAAALQPAAGGNSTGSSRSSRCSRSGAVGTGSTGCRQCISSRAWRSSSTCGRHVPAARPPPLPLAPAAAQAAGAAARAAALVGVAVAAAPAAAAVQPSVARAAAGAPPPGYERAAAVFRGHHQQHDL